MEIGRREAYLYDKLDDEKVHCKVCSHRCIIKNGKLGFCQVRENTDGTLYTLIYGLVSSEAIDPIEKKPLYHFLPGSLAYSMGSIGCNFRCRHCQNWNIAQAKIEEAHIKYISPEDAVNNALVSGSKSIAWTYNEPTIWHEYTYDTAKLAKEAGLKTVYVTNGYITPEALEHISPYLDAFRVDIKAFTDEFYKKVCSAKLKPVLEATKVAKKLGLHVEIINLVISTLNDSSEEIEAMCEWIRDSVGIDTPVHFTRFHPDYRMVQIPATPITTLEHAYDIATKAGIKYVYLGNVFEHEYENTYCPACRKLLISRAGFGIASTNLTSDGKCPICHEDISVVL